MRGSNAVAAAFLACAALLSSAAADAAPAPTTPDQQAEHWLRVGYVRTDLALTALGIG